MQSVPLAAGPIDPAIPFLLTLMARRTHRHPQGELHLAAVQVLWQLCTAGVEVDPFFFLAAVEEAIHVLPACIALAELPLRGLRLELEGAIGVAGVRHPLRCDGAVEVKVEFALVAAVA